MDFLKVCKQIVAVTLERKVKRSVVCKKKDIKLYLAIQIKKKDSILYLAIHITRELMKNVERMNERGYSLAKFSYTTKGGLLIKKQFPTS